jgi:hypothetical protein
MAKRLKSESCSIQCRRKMVGVIDEKYRLRYIAFFTEFSQKFLRQ